MIRTTWARNESPFSYKVRLETNEHSTISNISLYSGEAEITRVFKFGVRNGLNRATIFGLSPALREDTLRVDGQGRASINDVTVSKTPDAPRVNATPTDPLQRRRLELQKALESARHARQMLSLYLGAVSPKDVPINQLNSMLDQFASLTEKADLRVIETERQLGEIDDEIARRPVNSSAEQKTGRWQVGVLLDADENAEVKLIVKYVVRGADWTPGYDIRVDTSKKSDNITIVYKALIRQSTGENWQNSPLILETATPSFGRPPSKLYPWTLSVAMPAPKPVHSYAATPPWRDARARERSPDRRRSPSRSPRHRREPTSPRYSPASPGYSPRSPAYSPVSMDAPQAIPLSNKEGISATFQVPGLVDIPSDSAQHHVTIASMRLSAKIQWWAIPKLDKRVYLTAKIKNESEYTFIRGNANIFVDDSFVASTAMPPVSPQETFDCPLGSDPSIKLTYHPAEQRSSQSGIVSRSAIRSYTQRITIQNTKATSLESIKIVEAVPLSQDERINVKLLQPGLPPPLSLSPGIPQAVSVTSGWAGQLPGLQSSSLGSNIRKPIKVAPWIQAQWDKADEEDVDDTLVGKDGKMNWICVVPARQSVTLVLQCEVVCPVGVGVVGLDF
ncbi:hypothetical protein CPB83DRAFT_859059 [Crepidotus variabilis]|uniref:Uncharacterized protein n=1 Tax=Crepidotus variabilis TaxID=179855 RepID=A0A9P6JMD1_9AGAR|nr:hypothetical protein CPB83DRAFT_859059 [Crepidotus variabilis]